MVISTCDASVLCCGICITIHRGEILRNIVTPNSPSPTPLSLVYQPNLYKH